MHVLLGKTASRDTKIIEESCVDIINNRAERKTQAVGVIGLDSKRVRYE